MKIFLIRHGESMQNTGENYIKKLPDNMIHLTERGIQQAYSAGFYLRENIVNKNIIDKEKTILYVSPYLRTRQTAETVNSILEIKEVREDITLVEQNYGLFSDLTMDECRDLFPEQLLLYNKYYQAENSFYDKLPQGESPYDVAIRMRLFINTLYQNVEKGFDNFIIVSHGIAIKAFLLNYFNYSPEWFNEEPVMNNCAIRYIIDNEDKGNIYGDIFHKKRIKKHDFSCN